MFIALTTLERLREIPTSFWVGMGGAIGILILVVLAIRKLAGMNKVMVAMVALIAFSVFGFNWIYERNEPSWATPAVSFLAGFFPTKGALDRG